MIGLVTGASQGLGLELIKIGLEKNNLVTWILLSIMRGFYLNQSLTKRIPFGPRWTCIFGLFSFKHGVNMYTQKIRNYLAQTNGYEHIRVFMVHPGRMQTVMGKENAQILPKESANGIYQIIEKVIDPKLDVPFVNYKGKQMPY